MIEKEFKNEQAKDHLSYAILCGFGYEKFISGKGVYGNRVSLMRSKNPANLYNTTNDFKTNEFHVVEGIKSIEKNFTLDFTRKKLEIPFSNKENVRDFLLSHSEDFVNAEDIEKTVDKWYNIVSHTLLTHKSQSFNQLNKFVIQAMVMFLPINIQQKIAQFRKQQILDLVTLEIIPQDYAKQQLDLMPASKERLVAKKQELIVQTKKNKLSKENNETAPTMA